MELMKLNIQLFAHVKAQGSTKNGRDSAGRRLGAKASDGQKVLAGSIIYRQRGTKIYPGTNVGIGSDDTLYAKVTGIMKVERLGRDKKKISVYPQDTEKKEVKAKTVKKENELKCVFISRICEKKNFQGRFTMANSVRHKTGAYSQDNPWNKRAEVRNKRTETKRMQKSRRWGRWILKTIVLAAASSC